jgi:MOSC domain-containing protein YiiM
MKTVAELLQTVPQAGRVEWIGASTFSRGPIQPLQQSEIRAGTGLVEDHHARSGRSKRQVTLIQWEHLAVVASIMGRDSIAPELLRRNVAVSGINLQGLKDQQFRIGDVLLEGTGFCHPCSRMEEVLGAGGYHAMRGHGGITARVLQGGIIKKGTEVRHVGAANLQ